MSENLTTRAKRLVSYAEEIQNVLADRLSMLVAKVGPVSILDVGCGRTSTLTRFNERAERRECKLIGLDAHAATIEWCRLNGFHNEYVYGDARDATKIPAVDVIVATDLVEHFFKPEAMALLELFDQRAKKLILLLTPNGFIENPHTDENPFMEHKCGFTASEFRALGFRCEGSGGPKLLRKEHSLLRGPKVVALPAAALLSRLMRTAPEQSFHLLASKYK